MTFLDFKKLCSDRGLHWQTVTVEINLGQNSRIKRVQVPPKITEKVISNKYVYSVSLNHNKVFGICFLRRDVLTPPLPKIYIYRLVPGYDKMLSLLAHMNEKNKAGVNWTKNYWV